MKKILVPTDFSACAQNAIGFAVESAKIFPAKILLLQAFELMGNLYTDYMGVNKEFNQLQLRDVQKKITVLKNNILESDGIDVDTFVYTGLIKKGILELMAEQNVDLVVMGTVGASGIKEKLWGSKTADIIAKSPVPVLAIPLEYKWKRPAKILLVTNHFEKNALMLDFLFELAELFGASVNVVVFTNEQDDKAITYLEHARQIPSYEKMLKEKYMDSLVVTHLFGNDFEKVLQDYIRQNDIDILTMITYKRSFPESIFHPSMTKRMSYHTKIPLLALPANVMDTISG